jgi:hypothetical protein
MLNKLKKEREKIRNLLVERPKKVIVQQTVIQNEVKSIEVEDKVEEKPVQEEKASIETIQTGV